MIEVIPEELIDYKIRKWEKTRATRGIQSNFGGSMHRMNMAKRNF
jgi:hypothetical protein